MSNIFTECVKITITKAEDGSVVAYILSVIEKEQGEVATLYVDEAHRKNGIASNLLDKHISWFKDNKCNNIFVNVLYNNDSAINFYEELGFKKDIIQMRVPM